MIQFNYTITQAAAILNRSPKSVRSLIDAGKLQANEVGSGAKRKHFTVPPDAIEAFKKREATVVMQQINDDAYRAVTREQAIALPVGTFSRYASRGRVGQGRSRL